MNAHLITVYDARERYHLQQVLSHDIKTLWTVLLYQKIADVFSYENSLPYAYCTLENA